MHKRGLLDRTWYWVLLFFIFIVSAVTRHGWVEYLNYFFAVLSFANADANYKKYGWK